MKRTRNINECTELLQNQPAHLHIRREAIVTEFTEDFLSELSHSDDYTVVSVDVSNWGDSQFMETFRYELQEELSWIKGKLAKILGGGISGGALGFSIGGSLSTEAQPDYSRVNDYLKDVASNLDTHLVVNINYHGNRPVDGFSWVPKLNIPDETTLITDGFLRCDLDSTAEYEIGRLDQEQTVEYLTNKYEGIGPNLAVKIHGIHDGNPIAIELAEEQGTLETRLTGDALRELWMRVYDDKITGDPFEFLVKSSHLNELDQRVITSVTDLNRGEVKQVLKELKNKGVISQEDAGLFTTDDYVKRYAVNELGEDELTKKHRMTFRHYVRRWVEDYELRMQQMGSNSEENSDPVSPPNFDSGLADANLFWANQHLFEIHGEVDRETFITELKQVDAEPTGLFTFGMLSQRFYFDNPKEILQNLSESILDLEDEIENDLVSGTLGVFFSSDINNFLTELSRGWSAPINTDDLGSGNLSQPDERVRLILESVDVDFFNELPEEVQRAIAHLIAIPTIDTRKAREYYKKFGTIAGNYGLEEEPFCDWLDSLEELADVLNPEIETDGEEGSDPHTESYDSLPTEVRSRLDLKQKLEEHRSEAQREFRQRMDQIRSRPDKIAEQYIECGEHLEKMENNFFAYLWYAVGNELFAKIVLGDEHRDILIKYHNVRGMRSQQEKAQSGEDVVMSTDKVEDILEGVN